jgi:MoxR-like ATPase
MIDKKKIDTCHKFLDDIRTEMDKIIIGETSRKLFRAFALGLIAPIPYTPKGKVEERTGCGHIWLEAVPGTGKTLAAEAFALMSDLSDQLVYKRIQFTPDMMPAHIIGGRIFDVRTGTFRTEKGPIFANIVLIDEKNRGNPKTKSALLEAMQERQVTIEGETFILPAPFFVISTQNPLEEEGACPETAAEKDRFMFQFILSELSKEEEKKIASHDFTNVELKKVVTASRIMQIRKVVREEVRWESSKVPEYIVRLIRATRSNETKVSKVQQYVQWGIFSNRCLQHFFAAAKAQAFFNGRMFVTPNDIKQIAHEIMRHRIMLTANLIGQLRSERKFESDAADEVISAILEEVAIP